jgi:hypothetical protein
VNAFDAGKLALIVATPTLLGAIVVYAPKWWNLASDRLDRLRPAPPAPLGPPIEQLAADLRRMLRLHGEMLESAHHAIRAHRLWAIEAAIGVRAIEAARSLDVPHREPETPGALTRGELLYLLNALAASGLVLPAKVGPFTSDGRL